MSYKITVIFYKELPTFNLIITISESNFLLRSHANFNFSCRRVLVPFGLLKFMGPIDTHRANHEPQRQKAQVVKRQHGK